MSSPLTPHLSLVCTNQGNHRRATTNVNNPTFPRPAYGAANDGDATYEEVAEGGDATYEDVPEGITPDFYDSLNAQAEADC
jgi:hypothetical protein